MLLIFSDEVRIQIEEIEIDFHSQIFERNEGSGSYPISFYPTDKVRSYFNVPEDSASDIRFSTGYECRMEKNNGLPVLFGTFYLTECTADVYTGEIRKERGYLNFEYKETLLENIIYPFGESQYARFPVYNTGGYVNEWDLVHQEFTDNVKVAYPYLWAVLRGIFYYRSYNIDDQVFYSDAELATLVLMNNCAYYLDELIGFTYNTPRNKKVLDLIAAIEGMFNVAFLLNDESKEVSVKKIDDIIASTEFTELTKYQIVKKRFALQRDGYELALSYDSNDKYAPSLSTYKNALDETNFITDALRKHEMPSAADNIGKYCKVLSEQNTYKSVVDDADLGTYKWELFAGEMFNKFEEMREYTLTSDISPVLQFTDVSQVYPARYIMTPRMDVGVFSYTAPAFGEGIEHDFRLLFYRGMQEEIMPEGGTGRLYPFATSDVYDISGGKAYNWFKAIRWDTAYGLYENFHKNTIDFLLNYYQEVDVVIYLTDIELLNLRSDMKYRMDGVDYFLLSGSITVDDNDLNVFEGKAIKC